MLGWNMSASSGVRIVMLSLITITSGLNYMQSLSAYWFVVELAIDVAVPLSNRLISSEDS